MLKALKGFGSSCIKLSSLNYLNVLMGTTGVFNRFKIFGNHVNRHKNEGKLLLKCYRSCYRFYIFNILVCELNCLGPRSESWMNSVVVRSQLGTDWSVSLSIVWIYAVKFFYFMNDHWFSFKTAHLWIKAFYLTYSTYPLKVQDIRNSSLPQQPSFNWNKKDK